VPLTTSSSHTLRFYLPAALGLIFIAGCRKEPAEKKPAESYSVMLGLDLPDEARARILLAGKEVYRSSTGHFVHLLQVPTKMRLAEKGGLQILLDSPCGAIDIWPVTQAYRAQQSGIVRREIHVDYPPQIGQLHLYYDNTEQPAMEVEVGKLGVSVPAGQRGVRRLIRPPCADGQPIRLAGVELGNIPVRGSDARAQRVHVFLAPSEAACYALVATSYTSQLTEGDGPRIEPLQGHRIYPVPRIDDLFLPSPRSFKDTRSVVEIAPAHATRYSLRLDPKACPRRKPPRR
jgi:hypothetical protein